MRTWYRNDTNIIFFQSLLIFLTIIRQMAEIYWCEMNRTDHRIFGCDPVLPRGIYKGNPLSTSFLGFWSLIVEKWCLMDRDTSFFNIITPINNALFTISWRNFLAPNKKMTEKSVFRETNVLKWRHNYSQSPVSVSQFCTHRK